MNKLLNDITYSFRMMTKNLGLTLIIILSIGVGAGLNTTIFSVLNAMLLRPVPGVENPGRLVEVYTSYSGGMNFGAVSYPDYKDWRDRNSVFDGLLAQSLGLVNLNRNGENQIVSGAIVSGNYFSVLGANAYVGRTFSAEEANDTPGSQPVVVLGYRLWQQYFGGASDIVGKTITVNARNFVVVGVAPKDFTGAEFGLAVDIWTPISMQSVFLPGRDRLQARGMHWLNVIGRLKPGITQLQARERMKPVAAKLSQEFPATNQNTDINIVPMGDGPTGLRSFLLPVLTLLMVVVFLILLLACFNVANLLLSQASSREGEVALRLALGASQKDILRLMMTHSILLSCVAGAFALMLSYVGVTLIGLFKPPVQVPLFLGLVLDARVIVFSVGLSLFTGVLFGILPAIRASRLNLLATLRSDGFFHAYRRSRLKNSLVVLQIAISLFLLAGAGLVLRSLQAVHKIDIGFRADRLALASVDAGFAGYDSTRGIQLYQNLIDRVGSISGVRSVSIAQAVPMELGQDQQQGIFIEGRETPNHRPYIVDFNIVGPEYFRTMEIPLISGRDFTREDKADSPGVVIVNEAFAKRFWPNENPIGKRISTGGRDQQSWLQVIGVAKNSKYYSISEKTFSYFYIPFLQRYQPGMTFFVNVSADPSSYISSIRRELQGLDHNLPVFHERTMHDQLELSLMLLRIAADFLTAFGILALLLGCTGLYGLMAYSTAKRKPEIAVRMALGAQHTHVVQLILKEAMTLTLIGSAIGLIMTFIVGRLLSTFLYGVSATDPFTIAIVSMILVGIALIASFIPAWRATRVHPMQSLRST
jgi:putative ABC transport system permease protein